MLIIAGALSLLIWLYLFAAHGHFWRIGRILAGKPAVLAAPARIAVVIPARDEVDVVGRAVTSLLNQGGGHSIQVFLVDDGSSDSTAQAASEGAEKAGKSDMLTVIQGLALVPGWSGKLWAIKQGVETARVLDPDFFLFTDADIQHAPNSVATLVAIAQAGGYDLASFMVRLECSTFAERMLIPAFVFFFLKLYPPAWVADPRRTMAGAAGGSILIRPQALERAGGIDSIRGEVIDDCALARQVKASGGKVWLGLTPETRSIRSYGSFVGIGRMISRGAFNQLHHSIWMLLLAVAGLTAAYLMPPLLVIFSHRMAPALLGAAAWLLMSCCFLPTVRFYRLFPLWATALPVIAIFYMGASVHSALRYWTGRGGQWKGRIQDPAHSPPTDKSGLSAAEAKDESGRHS
ncbi:MAG TPA: glycosyltransferase [Candidatus Angelobacter sp.]|nr:glycosyltransferase [Candidatus Angelobacter sp.]